jgi:hypothetical protein
MLPDSFGKGDIGQGCVQCLRHWRSLLLRLIAQTIGESNRKTKLFLVMHWLLSNQA